MYKYHYTFIFRVLLIILLPLATMAQQKPYTYMESLKYPFPVKKALLSHNKEIAYVDEGKGPYTLLMVHGLGSYLPVYTKMVEALQQNFRCIAVDLPNYGKSSSGEYPFSMDFFAQTLKAFIHTAKLKNVILVGHSMGGQIGMTLALDAPGTLKGLVLLSPAGFETFLPEHRAWFSALMQPALLKATPPAQIERNFDVNFHNNKLPDDARFMLEDRMSLRADSIAYDAYCNMIPRCVMGMLDSPVFDRISSIRLPVLILAGEEDALIPNRILHPGMTPRQVAEAGHSRIPGSRLRMLSPCGHFVPWECAEEVSGEIMEFAGSLPKQVSKYRSN